MMDNWSIESAIAYLDLDDECDERDFNKYINSWCHFLTATILWDEIWFYDNFTSYPWQRVVEYDKAYSSLLEQILYPVNKVLGDNEALSTLEHEVDVYLAYEGASIDFLTRRNIYYQLLSNSLGINLLLHEKRMLQGYMLSIEMFNRLDIFRHIDRELKEYYQHINSLVDRELLNFKYPVLFDYSRYLISKKRYLTINKISELEAAIEIRQDKDIAQFRDEISHLEVVINNGNTQALLTQLDLIHNAVQELTNKYKEKTTLVELKLSLSPSISIFKTIPISIRRNKNMKIHTSFINRIIEFGVNQRYPN